MIKALTENGHVSLTNRLVHMYTESCKTRAECGWLTVRQEGSHLKRITARSWYKRKYLQWYTSWIPWYWHPGTHANRFEKTYPIYCHYVVMMQMWNRTTKNNKSLVMGRFQSQASCTPHIYRCFKFAKLYECAKPFKFHGCGKC